jgi:hypothetical protein
MARQEMSPREPEESQEDLNQDNESQKVSRRGFLKAATGAIIGASALGRAAEALAEDTPEKSKEMEKLKKDNDFLSGQFAEISGEGGVVIRKNGNLVIHIGDGHYYEIKSADSDKLLRAKEVRDYREDFNATKEGLRRIEEYTKDKEMNSSNKVFYKNQYERYINMQKHLDKTIKDFILAKIKATGQRISIDDLPDELKKWEEEREEKIMKALKKSQEKK